MTGPEPGDLAEIETRDLGTHVCRYDLRTQQWRELATDWSPEPREILAIRPLSVVPTDSLEALRGLCDEAEGEPTFVENWYGRAQYVPLIEAAAVRSAITTKQED